ncbi:MAG: 1-(5-phosphoribosyl)-5-amino-4-imidazole-carboxylate carboxylase, partial [Planctomycetota bacterium]|nr:1-(5-phosphoribosyl)-5-amino-4-imidazole-carboxylate carboxylase [Planctomycetota bacterium]
MNRKQLEQILTEVKNKQLSIDSAAKQIAATAIHSSDVANLDLHRELRTGAPEAVFCLGKSIDHCRKISEQYLELQQKALFTRCDVKQAQ